MVEPLYRRLKKMCRARGSSREDARDLVQEAHARLFEYQRSATVRDPAALLRRIVLSLSINHYHRKLAVPFKFERIEQLDRSGALTDPAPGPERILAAEQELNWVASLLAAISPRTCQIFLAQRGGYSYEEIAAAFAIKPRTVEKHVTTAAEALGEQSPFMPGPRMPSTRPVRIPLHSGAQGSNPPQGRGRP
jgi:RNA polymerase sigma-70 factor (ECF subfamily)